MSARLDAIASLFGGHYWTVRPFVPFPLAASRSRVWHATSAPAWARGAPGGLATAQPWSGYVKDAQLGRVLITGQLHAPIGAESLLLTVHGLGGNSESPYLAASVWAAARSGWACLRLNMRGAEGSGEDFYHAALTADLHAALASPEAARFSNIYVLGYSLGGHLALCFAAEAHDARVRAVAAVCAPLDLSRSAAAIDRPMSLPYRHHVLQRLKQSYAAVARRQPVPTAVERVQRVRSLREWDACTVVPRYGFQSTADYHARASVAGRLSALRVPALLVNATHDPMVPAHTVRPALTHAAPNLDVRWLNKGGHVGFPSDVDLGESGPRALEMQILSWFSKRA